MPASPDHGRRPIVEHDVPPGGPALARRHRPDFDAGGAFGAGFRTMLDLAIAAVDGAVVATFPTGRAQRFLPTSRGWLCTAGPFHELTVDGRRWELRLTSPRTDRSATAVFDGAGRLLRWRSPTGHLDVARDADGRADTLTDADRRCVHLDWSHDRIARATTDRGWVVAYIYDPTGDRLVCVRRPDRVVTYRWHGSVAVRRQLASVG